ncbi:MAG: DNA-binding domain-containing protein, partial [Pseudomonadota bacterium]
RFDVDRNNVVATAIDALADAFPAVRALVGDDFFRAAARLFFERAPPRSPLLFRYGDGFGAFLEGFEPAMRVAPYLGDVARLEFARVQAYHAADAAPLPIARLGAVAPDAVGEVRLIPHPSLALIRSRFPVVSLWAASTGRGREDAVDLARAEDAMILRPALDVDLRLLPAGGAALLAALVAGRTLADAAAEAAADFAAGVAAADVFDLSTHLAGLFDAGAFVDLAPGGSTEPSAQATH